MKFQRFGHQERPEGERRMKHTLRVLAAVALPLLGMGSPAVLAHGATAGSPPFVPESLHLRYQQPAEIVGLFARETAPASSHERMPRSARSGSAESLVPSGVDAVLRGADDDSAAVVLVGFANALAELRDCIQVLDVPVRKIGPDCERVVLTLRQGNARRVRSKILRLPEAGSATAIGQQLVLEGKAGWIHRSLRLVIRAELRQPELPDAHLP